MCYTYNESGVVFVVVPSLFGLVFFMHSQPRQTVKILVEKLIHVSVGLRVPTSSG